MSKFGVFLIIVCVAFVVNLPRGWASRGAFSAEIKPFDQVIADCAQTLETDPDNQSACEQCGAAYIEKGDKAGNFTEAKAAYEKAIEFYSRLMTLNQSAEAYYYGRGLAYHKLGNRAADFAAAKTAYDRALADYGKSIELNNQDEQAWDRREEIYMETGEYSKAIASYTCHLAVQPGAYNEYYRRGYAYDLIGEYAKALMDYDNVIKRDQYLSLFETYEKRGQLYVHLKKYEEAIADFTVAVKEREIRAAVLTGFSGEVQPLETDKLKCAEAHYLRAGAYYAKGEYAKAFSDCVWALELCPDYAEARIMKGKLFKILGKS